MRHFIIGGDGFVGRQLATDLLAAGETVVVADIARDHLKPHPNLSFVKIDIRRRETLDALDFGPADAVYNMAAKMLSPIQIRRNRREFFWPVNFHGVENLLDRMEQAGARNLVQFTTDMIYGHTHDIPKPESARKEPLGEYGKSKLATEQLCMAWREKGFNITIFRPRLIIGPGRLGILVKLFKLIDLNLPVPLIGTGKNPYQFISVFDCASAAAAAWRCRFPNKEYNLGSNEPPPIRKLLGDLIAEAGSKSILVPMPASLVKSTLTALDAINMPIMDPEQYLIADETCILDTSALRRDLGWRPMHRDEDMLKAAYREYRAGKSSPATELKAV
jgi:dTDP-glucose 4,6-dehydratase